MGDIASESPDASLMSPGPDGGGGGGTSLPGGGASCIDEWSCAK